MKSKEQKQIEAIARKRTSFNYMHVQPWLTAVDRLNRTSKPDEILAKHAEEIKKRMVRAAHEARIDIHGNALRYIFINEVWCELSREGLIVRKDVSRTTVFGNETWAEYDKQYL